MHITYNNKGEQILRLNSNATNMIVLECLECNTRMFIENGIYGYRSNR